MVKRWLVRLKLARDDGGSLSEEGIRELTDLLTASGVPSVLEGQDSGTILVEMTIDAGGDRAARATAERMLRERAHDVWLARGLPPFTITFIEAKPDGDATR